MRTRMRRPDAVPQPRTRYVKARPVVSSPRFSIWDPIPLGVNERGETVAISLAHRNILIGGIPNAGKSAAMSLLLAATAMSEAEMYLVDGKMIEFAVWEDRATRFAHKIEDAIALLAIVREQMEQRLQELYKTWKTDPDKGVRAVQRGQHPLIVIFIDELALFTTDQNTKLSKEFTMLLTDIVARGRAPGFIVCAATQKPDSTVVSTHLRDLFAYRLALCCSTPEASDTILGRGWAAQGYNAQDIAIGLPGLGYLLAEDGRPQRIRTYYLDDNDVRAYAAWAKEERQPK